MLTCETSLCGTGLPTLECGYNKANEAMEQSLSRHLLSKGFFRAHNTSRNNDRRYAIDTMGGQNHWNVIIP